MGSTPMRNRKPAPAGWRSIEAHHLSAADRELLDRVATLERHAHRTRLILPAALAAMRSGMAGQPKSATYGAPDQVDADDDRDPRALLWCFDHERTADQCDVPRIDEEGVVLSGCPGVKLTGPSDPTGSAALGSDTASHARQQLARELTKSFTAMDAVEAILAAWPVVPSMVEDAEPSPGEDWCVICWKDDRYCEPITTRRGSGQPYYRDRCRWCGDMTKLLGGDPPSWMVARRHRGERISQAEIAKATREKPGKNKKRTRK